MDKIAKRGVAVTLGATFLIPIICAYAWISGRASEFSLVGGVICCGGFTAWFAIAMWFSPYWNKTDEPHYSRLRKGGIGTVGSDKEKAVRVS